MHVRKTLLLVLCFFSRALLADTSVAGAPARFECVARLQAARAELLREHFDPARDTEAWLRVSGSVDGGLLLEIHTVYSPDGDGMREYQAEILPAKRSRDSPWHLAAHKAWDEFHDELLPERTWTKTQTGWTARIHTRTEDNALLKLFERVVKPALDDCLGHPGQQGKIERCEYSTTQNQWHCAVR